VAAIAELEQDRVVEGVYAVARKERLRTRAGAPYLALELVDRSGRIEARVWSDVELLQSGFGIGAAIARERLGGRELAEDPVRRKDRQPGIVQADENDQQAPTFRRALLLVVRQGRLVAMVSVGDQEAAPGERVAEIVIQGPEPRALDLQLG